MTVDVKVPRLAESISEATLVEWLKPDGSAVRADEPIATLETDKAAVELVADAAGVLSHARQPGDVVKVGDVLGRIEAGAVAATLPVAPPPAAPVASAGAAAPAPSSAPVPSPPAAPAALSPSVRRIVEEQGLDPARLEGTGPRGRILKEDALRQASAPVAAAAAAAPEASEPAPVATPDAGSAAGVEPGDRVVPMSRIRLRIGERLVQAQHTAAILTTFNEIDMSRVMDVRARHKEAFEKKHGVKLGFMSFFARACVQALADVPAVNAEIRGTDIVYKTRVHMGVAVGTERGLVVPVVRDAQRLSFAEIEREILRLAERARESKLSLDELSGGTFTISNGGVYGSLLSTPILNPPQSAILGMHKIQDRPMAIGGKVEIRPMMYLAVSYDHRIVDGKEAVSFLVRIKEGVEDPRRLLLDL